MKSVLTGPGPTAFTLIPYWIHSTASARVKLTTPPLLAVYGALPTRADSAICEPVLMIRPPP